MASSTPTIDEICAQAALRNVALRQATQEASETLCYALRAVTGSMEVPEEFLPRMNSPAPDLESLLSLIALQEREEPPEAQPAVLSEAAAEQEESAAPAPTRADAVRRREGAPPSPTPAETSAASTRNIAFQPVAWPTFGASPPAASLPKPANPSTGQPQPPDPERPTPKLGPNEVYFAPGELLFNKGDAADRFYVIRQGQVALFEPGSKKQIATLEPGTSFGEQAILVGGVRSVSAQSVDGVVCLALSAKALREMLEIEQGSIKPVFEALLLQLYLHNDLHARGHRYNA